MISKLALAAVACLAGAFTVHSGLSPQDAKNPPKPPTPEEMKAQMEAYEQAAQVGDQHKVLQKLAGKWDTVSKMSAMPGMPAAETKGTSEARSILGGRQVLEQSQGTMMGKPFNGLFLIGYDNTLKEY